MEKNPAAALFRSYATPGNVIFCLFVYGLLLLKMVSVTLTSN